MRLIPHSDNFPVSTPKAHKYHMNMKSVSFENIDSETSDNKPHWITQEDMNDLAHNFYFSKQHFGFLATWLKQ